MALHRSATTSRGYLMARPAVSPVEHGTESWDTTINDNSDIMLDGPFPIKEVANIAALPAAASFDRCLVATTDSSTLWISDGAVWKAIGRLVSTTERATGYSAVNSKTVYKKSFTFSLVDTGAKTQAHGVTGLDIAKGDFMSVEVVASDGTTVRVLPWYDGTDRLVVKVDATNITITSTKDETGTDAFVTLYYTKA